MFFKYDIPPARMERLFASFSRQAVRVERIRRSHMIGIITSVPLFCAALWYLLGSPSRFGLTPDVMNFFCGLLVMGLVFLGIGWLVSSCLARPRHPLGISPGAVFSIIGIIVFGLPLCGPDARAAIGRWLTRLAQTPVAADAWVSWALAGAGVFFASWFVVWLRLAAARVQLGELDHMKRVVGPLLRDLPPSATCSLVCNPYPSRWTVARRVVKHGDRVLGIYDDVLLDFRAVLPGGDACSVRTSHRRIDKYKARKAKFKGRKHVIGQRIFVERPGAGPLEGAAVARFDRFAERFVVADPSCVTVPSQETIDGVLRLSVKRKWKFSHPAEQPADKLPDPQQTLATLRSLSRLSAGLDG